MSTTISRWGAVALAVLVAFYILAPTVLDWTDGKLDGETTAQGPVAEFFVEQDARGQTVWKRFQPMTLGLDLQGGMLLQYHVYVDRAVQDRLERMARDIEARLETKSPNVGVTVVHPEGELFISVEFAQAESKALVDEDFMGFFPSLNRLDMGRSGLRLEMDRGYIEETKGFAITQAIETIRSRIDALGVSEPSITRQGQSDIVVQLPGLREEDVERTKRLIGQTAQLRFQMVNDDGTNAYFSQFRGQLAEGFALRSIDGGYMSVTHNSKEALMAFFEGKTDAEHMIGYQHHPVYIDREAGIVNEQTSYWKTYYIKRKTELTGDYIQDARVSIDQQFNRPYVALNFDAKGAELFAATTTEFTGKRFAIMMDDIVNSAPVINEPITGGRAQITLGQMRSFMEIQQEAQDLVIVLRHGALPAPIERQFETLVGPTLGQESIDSSVRALLAGSFLVIFFMIFYYRKSGLISTAALSLNLLFIMALLSAIGATLTLPGIAGIILTVGMAVDANVIIFERIREELLAGKSVRESVKEGFDKALSAVLDANITTGIAALVLLQYGTGPIKGFAVTLLIGIVCTVLTAVVITRMMFEQWTDRTKATTLSI
ncbi:MAG: protein translocase subunit SecD [Bradymonadaceae bacterium]|nr:protein translocase subunit SecD [Lujinxingiaceae bacterium]